MTLYLNVVVDNINDPVKKIISMDITTLKQFKFFNYSGLKWCYGAVETLQDFNLICEGYLRTQFGSRISKNQQNFYN